LPLLTQTRAVVDESLRLYPPAFVIVRQAIENDLADNVPVKKGFAGADRALGPAPPSPLLERPGAV
jgi:hypothetical protein